ncbi:MAG: hypothetical protein AMXMBFR36_21350 [Acidobacteriota bacterium]
MRKLAAVLALLLVEPALLAEIKGNHYRNESAGFEFIKPDSWFFATQELLAENQKHLRIKDKEFDAKLRAAKGPLASTHKYPAAQGGVNPNFQVSVLTLDDWSTKTARQMVRDLIEPLKASFEDLSYVDDARETTIDGREGARAGIALTRGVSDGTSARLRTDIVVVPRGEFMYMIGLSRELADEDSGLELEAILKTFAFVD